MSQLGLQLRDMALAQSQQGRQERIEAVREFLRQLRWIEGGPSESLTGDDAMEACEALGFLDGDHRWIAHVFKGWAAVSPTVNFVPSRRKERHHAPLRVWRWV